jgi:predicted dithiol-disulfide oxidoreductase (DUF899 family)
MPLGGPVPADYLFDQGSARDDDIRAVRISELFRDGKDTLVLYSFMYGPGDEAPCPLCTSFIDAIDGELRHLTRRINFAAVARSPIERFREHARNHGWRNLQLLSSSANTFNADYHAESPDGAQRSLAHVFVQRDGAVRHTYTSEMFFAPLEPGQSPRHVDSMWPLWNAADWDSVGAELEQYGCALTGPLLSPEEAVQIAAMYPRRLPIPVHRQHGSAPLRRIRVPLLRRTVPRRGGRPQAGALPAAAAHRRRLVEQVGT